MLTLWLALAGCGTPAPQVAPDPEVAPAGEEPLADAPILPGTEPVPPPTDARFAQPAAEPPPCGPSSESACVYEAGRVRQDPAAYKALLVPSCERGHAQSCTQLGLYLAEDGGASRGQLERLFRYGCTRGIGGACLKLADYVEGEERQVTLERGCALRSHWACVQAGLPTPEPASATSAAGRAPGSAEWLSQPDSGPALRESVAPEKP